MRPTSSFNLERSLLMINPAPAPASSAPDTAGPAKLQRIGFGLILLLGALTAVGPFTIDLYLAAFPQITSDWTPSRLRSS